MVKCSRERLKLLFSIVAYIFAFEGQTGGLIRSLGSGLMNSPDASTLSIKDVGTRSEHSTRLSGFWLILARGICVALFVYSLTVFFASLPGYFARLQI